MTDTPPAALFTFFEAMPRQGPGSANVTTDLFNRLRGDLPVAPLVADMGCGNGAAGLSLARAGCRVTGVDVHPPFLEAFQAGDSEAFDQLVERYQGRLLRFARGLLADGSAAEDVVQEAFVRVWRRRERLRDRSQLDGYVYAAVRNLALDKLRRQRTRAEHLPKLAISVLAKPAAEGPDVERIDRALAELPHEQREVVVLRVYLGLSFSEVAARAGCPLGTAHSRYRYAMSQLRERLVQRPSDPQGGSA